MEEPLNKFDRTIAILIQLQSGRMIRAKELAERFQVSVRTIYRDIRTLEISGIPVIGEAGSGYSLMEGYRLPPVMFSREEAVSLVTAEKLMQQFTDPSTSRSHESAINKIKAVLRTSEKKRLNTLENRIAIHPAQKLFNKDISDAFEIILEGITEKKRVLLKYQAITDEITERMIEPIGIFHEFNFWYILGYCLLRKEYRQFRIDRIKGIQRTEEKFTENHGELEEFRKEQFCKPTEKVRIRIDKKIARYIANTKKSYGFISEHPISDEKLEMTFMVSEIEEGFPRWFLMFADYAEIIEPEELKSNIKRILNRIQDKINKKAEL